MAESLISPPSEIQEPVDEVEYRDQSGPRWPLIAGLLIAALVVAVALVFGGRWVYQKLTQDETPTTSVQPGSNEQLPAAPDTNKPVTPPAAGTTPPTDTTPPPPNRPQTSPTPPSGELPNSGPGQTVALFVSSSLIAAGLHFVLSLRRQS